MAMWNRCAICGKSIPVGELCYGVKNWRGDPIGGDTICRDCLVPENAPTLTHPNELMEALEAINNAAVAYIEGGPYENDLPGMELAVEIDRLSRDFVRPPNEALAELEQVTLENNALWTYIEIVDREYRRYMDRGYIDRLNELKKVWKHGQKED